MFHSHEDDPKLCPVKSLCDYIRLTDPWRIEGEPTALFLSFISPHKPITKSRLAGWLKEALLLAEVDTQVFQAQSFRGAASSKALLKGLSVKEVVQHGNWKRESTWQRFTIRRCSILLKSSKIAFLISFKGGFGTERLGIYGRWMRNKHAKLFSDSILSS